MSRQLSNAARQAVYAQQTGEAFIILLTISHPDWAQPIRLASDAMELLPNANVRGVISRGMEYVYLPFTINLPQQDESSTARATVSIDNIDRRIVAAVRGATSAVNISIEIILASQPDIVEVSMQDFKMDRVTYDSLTVTGDISVESFELEPYPSKRFTPSDFPGLF